MKRSFLLILLFSCLIYSENSTAQKFTLGIIGGTSSSQISGDGFYGFAQFGLMAGADVTYKINDKWSANFGLQFNQKGARTYPSKKTSAVYRLRVNYIEAPLTLNYHINSFRVSTGFYLGVKINQKERTSFGPVDPERPFKTFDFGGQLSIGYQFLEQWEVALRLQNSLAPVRDHKLTQAYSPALFLFGDWHQNMLNKGQYFTHLSLILRYTI